MKKTYFIQNSIFTFLVIILLGCGSTIKHIIIAPELLTKSTNTYQQKQALLTFTDLRTLNHIAQIQRPNEEVAQLYSAQEALLPIVENTLTDAFKKNGLQIAPLAINQINVIIDKALINVQQDLVKYKATNSISLRIVIKNGESTLTKNFNINGNSNGPFNADIAVLERDFNQQLSKVLQQIVQNEEIQNTLK